ncbi:MAG: nuclear transport factor 2 family protein [Vicinamibacterales bacterium]
MSIAVSSATATAVVKEVYAAFGRRDVPAILERVADEVDWEFIGSPTLGYAGNKRDKQGVAEFFAGVARLDNITVFEPREFIEAGPHVTVIGWERCTSLDTGKTFDSEWIHVFTVAEGKITRWRGLFNTAARYGL